jgi:hypothetical protein
LPHLCQVLKMAAPFFPLRRPKSWSYPWCLSSLTPTSDHWELLLNRASKHTKNLCSTVTSPELPQSWKLPCSPDLAYLRTPY